MNTTTTGGFPPMYYPYRFFQNPVQYVPVFVPVYVPVPYYVPSPYPMIDGPIWVVPSIPYPGYTPFPGYNPYPWGAGQPAQPGWLQVEITCQGSTDSEVQISGVAE